MQRVLALLFTVLTGFAGLVYEVTWQKYVATLLGSHSEATAAVLGIFLAGLSVGYSLFGRVTRRLVDAAYAEGRQARLLFVYGAIEAGIGIHALAFPQLFEIARSISHALPLGADGLGFAFDVALVVALIGPPTVLMGGTIPLLTQALAHDLDDATRFHALVYGFNTIGAFAGALAAAFVLVPNLGLAGALRAMSAINLGAGVAFGLLGFWEAPPAKGVEGAAPGGGVPGLRSYALVALLSGFALMVVQNVAIRLGGLSLGSSEFTFATVVAVFVVCIALGSFGVSLLPRISPGLLVANQTALALLMAGLYWPLQNAPYWAHLLRIRFGNTAEEFIPFYLASFGGFLLVLGLPAIASGAVLPLLFHQLRQHVGDLGAVAGRIYSWNTVGSLLGALLGGYALLFFLDLHHVYRIAVGALAIGAAILGVRLLQGGRRTALLAGLSGLGVTLFLLPAWDPTYVSLSLFRIRTEQDSSRLGFDAMADELLRDRSRSVVFYDDDPTATIAVVETQIGDDRISRSIMSNGKSDGDTEGDYVTMALAAHVPALLASKAERAFVVGLGTGVTSGELAALESMQEVRVAEISSGVVAARHLFDFANLDASRNPKVQIVRSDAYRALMSSDRSYDIIVSEPSNPWMTGVEMLYSQEFLEAAKARLSPGGIYLQWYHQYETDAASVALVLRTFGSVFDRISVWYGTGADLFIVGFEDVDFTPDLERIQQRMQQPDLSAGLARSQIESMAALLAHELLPVGVWSASHFEGPIHTLYKPLLNHVAGAAFFRGGGGPLPVLSSGAVAEIGARNSLLRRYLAGLRGEAQESARARAVREACRRRVNLCATLLADWTVRSPDSESLRAVREWVARRGKRARQAVEPALIDALARFYGPAGSNGGAGVGFGKARRSTHRYVQYYAHAAPFDPQTLIDIWRRCEPPQPGDPRCEKGLARARALDWAGGRSPP